MEIGSLAIFSTFTNFIFWHQHAFSQLFPASAPRPISCSIWREIRLSLLIVSIICTRMDGARLIRDRTGDGLAGSTGCVGGELVAATIFELISRFHQTNVTFLDQIRGTAGPRLVFFLAIEITDAGSLQPSLSSHGGLSLHRWTYDGRDIFNLLDGQAGLFFNLLQLLRAALNVFFDVVQFSDHGLFMAIAALNRSRWFRCR